MISISRAGIAVIRRLAAVLEEHELPPYLARLLMRLHQHYAYLPEQIEELKALPGKAAAPTAPAAPVDTRFFNKSEAFPLKGRMARQSDVRLRKPTVDLVAIRVARSCSVRLSCA